MPPATRPFEIALKIRELSGVVVEAYSPADLMHGPIAAISEGWPVILLAPGGRARASVADTVGPLRHRGPRIIVISNLADTLALGQTKLTLVSGVPEWLSALTAVIPGQATALRLAQLRGLDIDNPTGLRKITLTL